MTAAFVLSELQSVADPQKARFLQRFFKTGKGEYAEGDIFLGLVVPLTRSIARANKHTPLAELQKLLASDYHEARLAALLILVEQFKKASPAERDEICSFYLNHSDRINNWDLVDVTCPHIVGAHLLDKDRSVLYERVQSPLLWDQRIAIVSTIAFIRNREYDDTLALSERLLGHKHDLMHKAVGWMLREVGKRDRETLTRFLDRYALVMPRTALRYSIEHFEPEERQYYMKLKK